MGIFHKMRAFNVQVSISASGEEKLTEGARNDLDGEEKSLGRSDSGKNKKCSAGKGMVSFEGP